VQQLIDILIDFPKLLMAAVNGPAIGISVTSLAFCDFILASEESTFSTPFSQLGLTPEGCSSFLLPQLIGLFHANAMLLAGRKYTSREAASVGLVNQVYPLSSFQSEVSAFVSNLTKLPKDSLLQGKELIRGPGRALLHMVNAREFAVLNDRYESDAVATAVAEYFSRKAQSKL